MQNVFPDFQLFHQIIEISKNDICIADIVCQVNIIPADALAANAARASSGIILM